MSKRSKFLISAIGLGVVAVICLIAFDAALSPLEIAGISVVTGLLGGLAVVVNDSASAKALDAGKRARARKNE